MIAGDIAYNDVHVHVGATDDAKRTEWIQTLREVETRRPRVVVAAHRRPDRADLSVVRVNLTLGVLWRVSGHAGASALFSWGVAFGL